MKYACSLLLAMMLTNLAAQDAIQGKIENYNAGNATVLTGLSAPIEVGVVKEDGSFEIPLTQEYKSKILGDLDEHNNSKAKWQTSLPTVKKAYGECDGKVVYTGGDQTMIEMGTAGMFTVGNMEEQKLIGELTFASSKSFAEAYMAFGQFKTEAGYQLSWLYFEEPATVSGECQTEVYSQSMNKYTLSSSYDLNFKAGWNIVKYEIVEVFTDSDGKKYPMKEVSTTLDALPDDVKIVLTEKSWR